MTSIKITFSDDDVVPQQVPKSQNASHIGKDVMEVYVLGQDVMVLISCIDLDLIYDKFEFGALCY